MQSGYQTPLPPHYKSMNKILLYCSLLISTTLSQGIARAAEITPIFGSRTGGDVVDETTDVKHSIKTSSMAGIILSSPYEFGKTLEIYYSHQSSEIESISLPPASVSTSTPAGTIPLTIDYLHIGGTAPIRNEERLKTFVTGGLGFSYLSPDVTGLDSELRPSLSIGIGLKWPLTERIALRAEARGLATMFSNNSSIFCSGGCTISISGNFFTQYEAFAGITIGF